MVHGPDAVVAQVRVGEKTNEIPALRDLLKRLAIEGWLVIGDALHTQRDTAQAIIEAGAGYLLTVKRNQPGLLAKCAALPWTRIPGQTSVDRSKGRRVRRTIKVCDADSWIDFPHAAQIAQLRRTRTQRGRNTVEVVYLICSLPASKATPTQIGRWIQAHWRIENRVHWCRDVCFDEDRQTAHSGNGPEAMAALRNLAISLLRLNGVGNIAAALRNNAYHPEHALLILLTSRKETLP